MVKTTKYIITLLILLFTIISCRDDFDYPTLDKPLTISSDTISVDTVFNYTKSATYVLKLYNNTSKDYNIPELKLARGDNSFYLLNVNGNYGKFFNDISIRKKDSLYVFIEIDAKEAPINPLYEDKILINNNTNINQQVNLVSWIEKAKIHQANSTIASDTWTKNEAQVISENLTINDNLTIEEGTTIYFNNNAKLIIAENARLTVNGTLKNSVKFRSANHQTRYDSLPNQWEKIELKTNSEAFINYAKVIGAKTGIDIDKGKLNISNTMIVNNQNYGIYANNAEINAHNLLINNANLASLAIENGGRYQIYQSTFANFFNFINTAGPAYSLYLSNNDDRGYINNLVAVFGNCIFYNQRTPNSIAFNYKNTSEFNYSFVNNLFKNVDTNTINVLDTPNFSNSIVENPLFINPNYTSNNLKLKEESPAKNKGNLSIANMFPLDYYGNNRTDNPTIGAIQ